MCVMCFDESLPDLYRRLRDLMDDWGFLVMTSADETGDRGLAYTIGLIESRSHPELLIQGCRLDTATEILYDLGRFVGKRLRIDRRATIPYEGTGRFGTAWIDEELLSGGLLDSWYWFYGCRSDVSLKAIQIVLPDGACCFRHQTTQPLLGRLRRRRLPRAKDIEDERLVVRLPENLLNSGGRLSGDRSR